VQGKSDDPLLMTADSKQLGLDYTRAEMGGKQKWTGASGPISRELGMMRLSRRSRMRAHRHVTLTLKPPT